MKTLIFVFFGLISMIALQAQTTFTMHEISRNTRGASGIHAKDLDNDGDLDIVAASLEDNQVVWWEHKVNAEDESQIDWVKKVIASDVTSAHSVYAEDFDQDGDYDIAVAQYAQKPGVLWYENKYDITGEANFQRHEISNTFYGTHEIYASDLDGDGDADIIGASSDLNRVSWWRNDGGNPIIWTEFTIGNGVGMAKSISTGDVDNDGDMDVVAAALWDHDIIFWKNDGADPETGIQWRRMTVDGNFNGSHKVQVVDIDGNGSLDILGAAYMGGLVSCWYNYGNKEDGSINWSEQSIARNFDDACHAQAIDLDNDGLKDIVATGQGINTVSWWNQSLVNQRIGWRNYNLTTNFRRPWGLYCCDLDGDGDNDIIVGTSYNGNRKVVWWENHLIDLHTNGFHLEKEPVSSQLSAYPNPASEMVEISFNLKKQEKVELCMFDLTGRKVKTMLNQELPAGTHKIAWEFVNNTGNPIEKGCYICRLMTNSKLSTLKIISQ